MAKRSKVEKKRAKEPTRPPPPPETDDNPDQPFEIVFAAPVKEDTLAREPPLERSAQEDE